MPRFVDLFVEEIRRSRSDIQRIVGGGLDLATRYEELVKSVWVNGFEARDVSGEVVAVDSSSDEIEVAGGGVILVTRALALGSGGNEVRKLRVDALFPMNTRDYEDFKRLLREHLEHLAALDAVRKGASIVMLDGSLFGRMSHVPKELDLEGREDFALEYIETYGQLFEEAFRNGVVVVGVSKDSRSTVLREELLLSEVKKLLASHPAELSVRVLELWSGLKRRPTQVLEEVRRLLKEGLDSKVYELFEEVVRPLPDSKLLLSLNPGPGFTLPLRLTLEKVSTGVVDVALSDHPWIAELLKRVFERTSDRLGARFQEKVEKVLATLRNYPAILTSYVVFSRGDDPVRVDVAVKKDQLRSGDSRFVAEPPEVFLRVLGHLAGLYAGRRGYNVLLLEADRRVRATAETMDLYHKIAMRELGELIVHSRSERRFFLP